MLVFSTQLCDLYSPLLPSPLLSGSTLPPSLLCSGFQTDKHLPQSPITGQFLQVTTFCIVFYESYLSMDVLNPIPVPSGWHMRYGWRSCSSNAFFMTAIVSNRMEGSKRQLRPTMCAPALAILNRG
jgi:hypothetical protein